MAKKGGLGKGLDALFIDNNTGSAGSLMSLRIGDIEPNKNQPRDYFDQQALQELADSIKENGLLQPIVVRQIPSGMYQIVAGERRWRACRMAGLSEVPAIVVEADSGKTMELALLENLQREDLSPMEEARGYKTLMEHYGLTQEQVAQKMGKSRPAIANSVRLLTLPQEVIKLVDDGKLSAGHAKVLAGLDDPSSAAEYAREIESKGLNVRQTEQLVKSGRGGATDRSRPKAEKTAWGDSYAREIEISIGEATGRHIRVLPKGEGGVLEIHYLDRDDLNRLTDMLGKL